MTDFSDFLPPGISNLGISSAEPKNEDRQELGQDQFFDLMVAQLTNQDPLNPLESNEFIAQVAQFSTVNGIKQVQESIGELATSFQSGQALQASTMVGRDVLVPGQRGVLHPGAMLSGAVDVASATGDLKRRGRGDRLELVLHVLDDLLPHRPPQGRHKADHGGEQDDLGDEQELDAQPHRDGLAADASGIIPMYAAPLPAPSGDLPRSSPSRRWRS